MFDLLGSLVERGGGLLLGGLRTLLIAGGHLLLGLIRLLTGLIQRLSRRWRGIRGQLGRLGGQLAHLFLPAALGWPDGVCWAA